VHLATAEMYLAQHHIPFSGLLWYPPLFHVWLITFLSFTGSATIEQSIFLLKCVTVLINWLVIFSVYLLGARFFGKKTGVFAASFLLLILPFYEINMWGGYTSIASVALMMLLILYLSLNKKDTPTTLVIFMLTFFMVLTHQLTTFLAVITLGPFVLVMLFRSKGRLRKTWLAVILGGVLAFGLYYAQTIIPHIGDIIYMHLLSPVQSMIYQIPGVTPASYILDFGFLLIFAALGIVVGFFKCRENKTMGVFALLALSFFVPLILSQTYLIPLYLPFERFLYYIVPITAIFAGIAFTYIIEFLYSWHHKVNRKVLVKIVAVVFVVLMVTVMVFRFETMEIRINQGIYYYSTSDLKAYDAAVWLRENYPDAANVTVTEKPGSWFGLYSGKMVNAANNQIIQRNVAAECVLDLADEIEITKGYTPLTLVRAYDAKGSVSDENYVSMDGLWRRVSDLDKEAGAISFSLNGQPHSYTLTNLSRELTINNQNNSAQINIKYYNEEIVINEEISASNDNYAVNTNWTITPLTGDVSNVSFSLGNFMDLSFEFKSVYLPGILNWENPWDHATEKAADTWTVYNYTGSMLTDNYIGLYDEKRSVAFELKFGNLPDWGNVGVLSNGAVNALRTQYQFSNIEKGQNQSVTYQILTFSKTSYPNMPQPNEIKSMFTLKTNNELTTRNFLDYIKESNIQFIVYNKDRFFTQLLQSNILTEVYANNDYIICKIKNNI
jgi:hypothetical protein